jgi:hypothetical protein
LLDKHSQAAGLAKGEAMEHELSKARMEKAIAKAKTKRCHVVVYGHKLASCNCAARLICYHIAAAAQAHCIIAAMKKEAEPLCQETPQAVPVMAGVLVKSQPASLGRIGGFEI